jgi:quercetin dioxygenase-like cupin family protein
MRNIPFQCIDWNIVKKTEQMGETGSSLSQTIAFEGIQMRIVEYSENYLSDHWCQKGHIVQCLEGEFECELESGGKFNLKKGMTFIVSDNLSSHRIFSNNGAKLLN